MARLPSAVKISFAPGTKLGDNSSRGNIGGSSTPTFNLKPVKHGKRNSTLIKPPSSTMLCMPYRSTTQLDFGDPNIHLRHGKAMNTATWVHRSQSLSGMLNFKEGLLLRRNLSRITSAKSDPSGTSSEQSTQGYDYSIHKRVNSGKGERERIHLSQMMHETKLLPWSNNKTNDYRTIYFKPLVGNTSDRYIEDACVRHSPSKDGHFLNGAINGTRHNAGNASLKNATHQKSLRFYETVNVVPPGMPRHLERGSIQRPHSPTLGIDQYMRTQRRIHKSQTEIDMAVPQQVQHNRSPLKFQKQKSAMSEFHNSMERTYRKQALVRDLLNGNSCKLKT